DRRPGTGSPATWVPAIPKFTPDVQPISASIRQRPQLRHARAELLGDGEAAQQGGGLLELVHHRVDGALAVAAHDAVEGVEEVLLDRLARRVADVLLGHGADARGQVD